MPEEVNRKLNWENKDMNINGTNLNLRFAGVLVLILKNLDLKNVKIN